MLGEHQGPEQLDIFVLLVFTSKESFNQARQLARQYHRFFSALIDTD